MLAGSHFGNYRGFGLASLVDLVEERGASISPHYMCFGNIIRWTRRQDKGELGVAIQRREQDR
jgi:hypothetical protein